MSGSKSSNHAEPHDGLDPLALTVHSLPEARVDESTRTRTGRWKLLLVLLVCASPVLASYFMYYVVRPDARNNYATLIQPSRAMPELKLKDLNGQTADTKGLKDQWILVVVDPSACAVDCEAQLYMQRQLREMMGRERDRMEKLWLITDEGEVKPELLQALQASPAMHLLRADRAEVAAWLEAEAGQTLEQHLYVVDPMGQWMMRSPISAEPMKMKKDLDRLLRASSFWDKAGGR